MDKTRLNNLPEDLKPIHHALSRFNRIDDLFRSYAHSYAAISHKGLIPLRPDATDAEKAEHLKALAKVTGAPDKPEEYGLKRPDNVPEDQWDQGLADLVSKVAHKHALSPSAVKELAAEYDKHIATRLEAYMAEQEKAEATAWAAQEKALKDAFGPYAQEKFDAARRGAKWMGVDPDAPFFKQNAALIIAAAKVGEKIQEAALINGDSAANAGYDDPEKELSAMASDPNHKYYAVMRNPQSNPRLFHEAQQHQLLLGRRIAAKRNLVR